MDITSLIFLILIGFLAGIISGFAGVGGGIIVVPALVLFLGFSQAQAQGTSLAMMLPPIGILAAYNYFKSGYVNIKYAAILAVVFIIGSYFGSKVAVGLPEITLKRIFGVLMLLVAFKMMFGK